MLEKEIHELKTKYLNIRTTQIRYFINSVKTFCLIFYNDLYKVNILQSPAERMLDMIFFIAKRITTFEIYYNY